MTIEFIKALISKAKGSKLHFILASDRSRKGHLEYRKVS